MLKVLSDNFGSTNDFLKGVFGEPDHTIRIQESAPRIPLVILIFGCATNDHYKQELQTIEETWGADARAAGIPYFVFLGEEKTDLRDPHYIYLPGVKNDYNSAITKQFAGYSWICERYNPDVIYAVGSDTFINIPKLKHLVSIVNPETPLLLGNDGFIKQLGPLVADFLSGGGGLLTTRETHRRIIGYCKTIIEKWNTINSIFRCDYFPAVDVALSFLCHYLKVIFVKCTSIHHCPYNGHDALAGPINPANVIACHSMKRDDCLTFYQMLKENGYFMDMI
jgi:hypothetical protein